MNGNNVVVIETRAENLDTELDSLRMEHKLNEYNISCMNLDIISPEVLGKRAGKQVMAYSRVRIREG